VKHFVQYGSIQNQQIYVITKKSSRKYMNCMPTKIRWRHRDQHFNELMVIFSFLFFSIPAIREHLSWRWWAVIVGK